MEIIFLVFGAIIFGFFLIFVAALAGKKQGLPRVLPTDEAGLDFARFERVCSNLLLELKLEIDEIHRDGDNGLSMQARNPTPITGGPILVQCAYLPKNQVVQNQEILELSNAIIQERASKGIFITTGTFTSELAGISELAPIEFIDGKRLADLVNQYHL